MHLDHRLPYRWLQSTNNTQSYYELAVIQLAFICVYSIHVNIFRVRNRAVTLLKDLYLHSSTDISVVCLNIKQIFVLSCSLTRYLPFVSTTIITFCFISSCYRKRVQNQKKKKKKEKKRKKGRSDYSTKSRVSSYIFSYVRDNENLQFSSITELRAIRINWNKRLEFLRYLVRN